MPEYKRDSAFWLTKEEEFMLISLLRSGNIVSVIMYILSVLLTIFLVLPLHECAHGLVAYKLGDDTAKRQRRLTLNPLEHIDYLGACLMLIIGFGWAKPVPINPRRFKNPKAGMALTALAGPVSNLLAAVVAGFIQNGLMFMILKGIIPYNDFMYYVLIFFEFLVSINIGLAVFNFIPIPPLDGSKILMAFLPNRAIIWIEERIQIISIVLFLVVMMGGLDGILGRANNLFYGWISWLTWLPFSFFTG